VKRRQLAAKRISHQVSFSAMQKFVIFIVSVFFRSSMGALLDQNEQCSYWASVGECDKNPNYMLVNCAKSCDLLQSQKSLGNQQQIQNFYSIIEKDINGKEIKFEQFRNKIVYIVNVASYCGYTNENYDLLKSLSPLRSNKFEILILPCNQFGQQEPGDSNQITSFASSRGFNGIILSKGDVNGQNTRPTFQFLKQATGKKQINWYVSSALIFFPNFIF
jgi:glutathione peroxidase